MAEHLIILGASARAAAESALRAGYEPWCIDLFADRDLVEIARVQRCPRSEYPQGMLQLLNAAPQARVLLTGAMENHLDVVRAIALERELLGSGVEALSAARQPGVLEWLPEVDGLRSCAVIHGGGWRMRAKWWWASHGLSGAWMSKPVRSAGGRGVQRCRWGLAWTKERYLQRLVQGRSMGVIFFAEGGGARMLGVTEQIIGEAALGAKGFEYAGSIGPVLLGERTMQVMQRMGVALAQRLELHGLFGVDVVMDEAGVIWPVEINPRYTASVEVIERATGVSALRGGVRKWMNRPGERQHQSAERAVSSDHATEQITGGTPVPPQGSDPCIMIGKAVVRALQQATVGDLYGLFTKAQVSDVPGAEEVMEAGEPVCTVWASGVSVEEVRRGLHEAAQRLYTHLRELSQP